jgi:hypothetical protein
MADLVFFILERLPRNSPGGKSQEFCIEQPGAHGPTGWLMERCQVFKGMAAHNGQSRVIGNWLFDARKRIDGRFSFPKATESQKAQLFYEVVAESFVHL